MENYVFRQEMVEKLLNRDEIEQDGFLGRLIKEVYNQDIVLAKAGKDLKDLREVALDSQVSAAIDLRKNQILKLKWDIDRGTDANFYSEWLKNIMKDWDINQMISDIIDARCYGYTVLELIWQQYDYFLVIKDIQSIPPWYFSFDSHGQIHFKKNGLNSNIDLSKNKFVVVKNKGTRENPYGESLLAKTMWWTIFKKGAVKFWAEFTEKYGQPFLVGKIDSNDKQKIVDMNTALAKFRRGGVGTFFKNDEVDSLKANDTASSQIFEGLIKFCNDEITKVFLSHSSAMDATAGELGNTSKALTTMDIIAMADKQLVESIFQKIINILININFHDCKEIPKIEFFEEKDIDMELAQRDLVLSQMGVSHSKEYFMSSYGLKEGDFELKTVSAAPQFSESESDDYQNIIDMSLQKYVEIVNNSSSYKEAKEAILTEFSGASDDEIEWILARAITLSEAQAAKDESKKQNAEFSMFDKFRRFIKWN